MTREQTLRFTEKELIDALGAFAGTTFSSDNDESDNLMIAETPESEWVDVEREIADSAKSPEQLRIEGLLRDMIRQKFGVRMERIYSDHAGYVYVVVK